MEKRLTVAYPHMDNDVKLASWIANVLDNRFQVFGMNFGIDAIIGLIPEFGDGLIMVMSLSLIAIALKKGLPAEKITKMVANLGFGFAIGLIPVIGDIAYFAYRPNWKNFAIIKEAVEKRKNLPDGHSSNR